MTRQSAIEVRFREQIRRRREQRKWSQADVAKRLHDNGLRHMISSMVAKIESGDRAVRIDEANALAELFETSVDVLLGRAAPDDADAVANEVRLARHTGLKVQLDIQASQAALIDATLGLRAVTSWQPDGDALALMEGFTQTTRALAKADRILTTTLATAGGTTI
jgi:transcriptional regulator with XRE-family HTH domain